MTIYAIGDIHGQRAELERALALIEADGGPDAKIVFVGDYVDRGPDSRGILDILIEGRAAGRPWTCLKGNHDRLMEWFLEDEPRHDPHLLVGFHWFHERIGGVATMASYGVDVGVEADRLFEVQARALEAVPESHRAFLRGLPLYHEVGGLLFVHAGIVPGVTLADQRENDLLWIRKGFVDDATPHPWLVVHGHTAVNAPEHAGNRINLDGGAGYGRPLIPVAIEGASAFTLSETGRTALQPPDSRLS